MIFSPGKNVVVHYDFGNVERQILLSFPEHLLLELTHVGRFHGHALDDKRRSGEGRAHIFCLELDLADQRAQAIYHGDRIDDLAVNDHVFRKLDDAEMEHLPNLPDFLELN